MYVLIRDGIWEIDPAEAVLPNDAQLQTRFNNDNLQTINGNNGTWNQAFLSLNQVLTRRFGSYYRFQMQGNRLK